MVPVTRVTPDDGFYMHTFYDVCLIGLQEQTFATGSNKCLPPVAKSCHNLKRTKKVSS
jgi:hypothetical protein